MNEIEYFVIYKNENGGWHYMLSDDRDKIHLITDEAIQTHTYKIAISDSDGLTQKIQPVYHKLNSNNQIEKKEAENELNGLIMEYLNKCKEEKWKNHQ